MLNHEGSFFSLIFLTPQLVLIANFFALQSGAPRRAKLQLGDNQCATTVLATGWDVEMVYSCVYDSLGPWYIVIFMMWANSNKIN